MITTDEVGKTPSVLGVKHFWVRKRLRFLLMCAATYLAHTAFFWGFPFVWMLALVFTKWKFFGRPEFIGFGNFGRFFTDPAVGRIALNTLNFLAYLVPMVLTASTLFALALKRVRFGKIAILLGFLLANFSSNVGYSLIFLNFLSVNGPVSKFFEGLIGVSVPWFSHPQLAVLSICLIMTWKYLGYYGLIIYTALAAIPRSVYDMAKLDNVNPVMLFFRVILPMISNALFVVTTFTVSSVFSLFTEPYIITGGGPMMRTMSFLMHMYDSSFKRIDPSYGATIALLTGFASMAVVILLRKLIEARSFEQDAEF